MPMNSLEKLISTFLLDAITWGSLSTCILVFSSSTILSHSRENLLQINIGIYDISMNVVGLIINGRQVNEARASHIVCVDSRSLNEDGYEHIAFLK